MMMSWLNTRTIAQTAAPPTCLPVHVLVGHLLVVAIFSRSPVSVIRMLQGIVSCISLFLTHPVTHPFTLSLFLSLSLVSLTGQYLYLMRTETTIMKIIMMTGRFIRPIFKLQFQVQLYASAVFISTGQSDRKWRTGSRYDSNRSVEERKGARKKESERERKWERGWRLEALKICIL